MNEWFNVARIDQDTYVISEYKHWEETHCYLLLGRDKALLIDTGLGVGDISSVVEELTPLPVMVATTHVHWDHIGGHKYFNTLGCHEAEARWLEQFPVPTELVKSNLIQNPCDFPEDFDIEDYHVFQGKPTVILMDNHILALGDRDVQIIHTPGHSPGHVCYYEKDRGYLYSGDLIYNGTLDAFYPSTDPYQFMLSIKKVMELQVNKILPGHHNLDIPVDLIKSIDRGFSTLFKEGTLKQGNGLFHFIDFSIHI